MPSCGPRVLIAPNEDGYGTSAWTVRIARALAAAGVEHIEVAVVTPRREAYHRLRHDPNRVTVTRLCGVEHWIELPKSKGTVDARLAVESLIPHYPRYRETYKREITPLLERADLVIELGVPPMGFAVQRFPHLRRVTVFDHAWSHTLREMAELAGVPAGKELELMRDDEAASQDVWLFPEPITPRVYLEYWHDLISGSPRVLPGCFGGLSIGPARRLLGIPSSAQAVLISASGTPVWDGLLHRLVASFLACEPEYFVVINNRHHADRLGVHFRWHRTAAMPGIEAHLARVGATGRVLFLDAVRGDSYQAIIPAFDLILTRAGGGVVNDAIAFRVPLTLVQEPGHTQVERIRHSCLDLGLAHSVSLEKFRRAGRRVIENSQGQLHIPRVRAAMQKIPISAEQALTVDWLHAGLCGASLLACRPAFLPAS